MPIDGRRCPELGDQVACVALRVAGQPLGQNRLASCLQHTLDECSKVPDLALEGVGGLDADDLVFAVTDGSQGKVVAAHQYTKGHKIPRHALAPRPGSILIYLFRI